MASQNLPKTRIYLDHAAATPVCDAARTAVVAGFELVGNPGSIHSEGVRAAEALEAARSGIARHLGVRAHTLVFTSGGTEANNLAIIGFARALASTGTIEGAEFLFSAIEHPSVLACADSLVAMGATVAMIPVSESGHINPETAASLVTERTVFASIGWGTGETGAVQPMRAIVQAMRKKNAAIVVHSDLGQAPLYLASDLFSLGIDLASLDSSKLYGPRGVGILFVKDTTALKPLLFGGRQERGLRPGSETVPQILGMAAAYEHIVAMREPENERLKALTKTLAELFAEKVPSALVNVSDDILPHMLNISIPGTSTEYITLALDHRGFAVSTKSACREGEESFSHVILAQYGDKERAKSTLRISLGEGTQADDVGRFVDELADILKGSVQT